MRRSILLAALVVSLSLSPAVAAADNPVDAFVTSDSEDGDCLGPIQLLCDLRDGSVARAGDTLSGVTDDRSADGVADDAQAAFNEHASAFETYATAHSPPDQQSADVVNLTFRDGDASATVYLTADVVDGEYTDASIDDTTDRTVDETCVLEENAARNAATEIETFHDRFAAPNESVTKDYMSRKATRYGGHVTCSFMED